MRDPVVLTTLLRPNQLTITTPLDSTIPDTQFLRLLEESITLPQPVLTLVMTLDIGFNHNQLMLIQKVETLTEPTVTTLPTTIETPVSHLKPPLDQPQSKLEARSTPLPPLALPLSKSSRTEELWVEPVLLTQLVPLVPQPMVSTLPQPCLDETYEQTILSQM